MFAQGFPVSFEVNPSLRAFSEEVRIVLLVAVRRESGSGTLKIPEKVGVTTEADLTVMLPVGPRELTFLIRKTRHCLIWGRISPEIRQASDSRNRYYKTPYLASICRTNSWSLNREFQASGIRRATLLCSSANGSTVECCRKVEQCPAPSYRTPVAKGRNEASFERLRCLLLRGLFWPF